MPSIASDSSGKQIVDDGFKEIKEMVAEVEDEQKHRFEQMEEIINQRMDRVEEKIDQ